MNLKFIAENILNRRFYADASNQKYLTDITEFKYCLGEKTQKHLSAILDFYGNPIVSYMIRDINNNLFVLDAFNQASILLQYIYG